MRSSTLVLFFILLIQQGNVFSQDVTGKWSGTMTMELWWEGITGPWHKKFDMTVQDNVVTGSMSGEGKLIIDGKELGHGNCFGEGTGELFQFLELAAGEQVRMAEAPPGEGTLEELHALGIF